MSEPARQAIEKEFGLARAQDHRPRQTNPIHPAHPEKVRYGQSDTLCAITRVLDAVLPKYTFTTLAELNAILRQYNVMADEGGINSRLRQRGGLVYHVLDEQGKKVGIPVNSSAIYNKPTLKFLQKQFARNLMERINRQEISPPIPKENINSQKERQRKRK